MTDPRSDTYESGAQAASIGRAFRRALMSQCHPAMLFAVLLPFLIALLGAILLLWLCWTPLTDWLRMQAGQWQVVDALDVVDGPVRGDDVVERGAVLGDHQRLIGELRPQRVEQVEQPVGGDVPSHRGVRPGLRKELDGLVARGQ